MKILTVDVGSTLVPGRGLGGTAVTVGGGVLTSGLLGLNGFEAGLGGVGLATGGVLGVGIGCAGLGCNRYCHDNKLLKVLYFSFM